MTFDALHDLLAVIRDVPIHRLSNRTNQEGVGFNDNGSGKSTNQFTGEVGGEGKASDWKCNPSVALGKSFWDIFHETRVE